MKNLDFNKVKLTDGFWRFYSDLNRNVTVKAVYERFRETGRFDSLSCSWSEGMPNRPHFFWDSDVAKWIEGVSYLLMEAPEPGLEALVDEMVNEIEKNQRDDGYYNSYFLTVEPANIYTDRSRHELYCTGHFIEAAIAYHKASGKDKLLNCMLKNVDLIYRIFLKEQSAGFVTPGHEEIELALLKLYDHLGDKKHLELASFFIDMRANNDVEEKTEGEQSDVPVREITEAVGHSVRACYLYTAMAMLAKRIDDKELKSACDRVFSNIINKKMSITGGVGTDHSGEKFSYDYDIPNSDTYNETCAAIALAMFAGAMQEMEINSKYADIIERIYYNGFISGLSLDGEHFFYANSLEVDRKKYKRSTYQVASERVKVFRCSCCPPNVIRMLASIPRYMYTQNGDSIYCNQFASSEASFTIGGREAKLTQITDYPNSGKLSFSYKGEKTQLYVRIPDWCVEYEGETNNGYACFELNDGDFISLDLPMNIHFIEANPNVQDNSGRCALSRGPVVYCMEEIDNGENLRDITLIENSIPRLSIEEGIPAPVIYMDAERRPATDMLYSMCSKERIPFNARLIPYFSFANRDACDMIVWVMIKSK